MSPLFYVRSLPSFSSFFILSLITSSLNIIVLCLALSAQRFYLLVDQQEAPMTETDCGHIWTRVNFPLLS